MIESLFGVKTSSLVRIVNGINKYVTETSEEIPTESIGDRCAGQPAAKARLEPKPTLTATSSLVKQEQEARRAQMTIPYRDRKWIDIEPKHFSQGMIRLPRKSETVHREQDGAVRSMI